MKYKSGIYIGLFIIVSLLYTWYAANRPEPLDWSERYSPQGKNPYDTYITYHNLSRFFPSSEVLTSRRPIVEELEGLEGEQGVNYIFINRWFPVSRVEWKALLRFVAEGNSLFATSEYFDSLFLAKFDLKMDSRYSGQKHRLLRPGFSGVEYDFNNRDASYFVLGEDFKGVALGILTREEYPDFVGVPYGKGYVFLNLNPRAFTNYYVLDSVQGDYSYKALSYLPDRSGLVVWDAYQTLGDGKSETPFRVLLKYPALRWAFYLLLLGGIMYAGFSMKREQRPVPVILPYENKMLDFVAAVSSLYYKNKDHYRIAEKRIDFFLERVRSRYKMRTDELNENFVTLLAEYSGVQQEKVRQLADMINEIRASRTVSEEKLRELVKAMERFPLF